MNKLTLLLASGLMSLNVWATSPIRPIMTVRCDQAEETTYVMQRPYAALQVVVGENPSTGYVWRVSSPLESTYKSDCAGERNPPPGCGGERTFDVSDDAIDAARSRLSGNSTFKFELRGPSRGSKVDVYCKIVIKKRNDG